VDHHLAGRHLVQSAAEDLADGVDDDHLGTVGAGAIHRRTGGGRRHDDGGLDAQMAGGVGHRQGVVSHRGGDHPGRPLLVGQSQHPMKGAAGFEGSGVLQQLELADHRQPE
jgi:hypothetical protein